jgi:HTH-type transcriptional regulator / antitoxin HigA
VSAPGETLADILDDQGLSIDQLAEQLGCSLADASALVAGEIILTAQLAIRLETAFGAPAAFWLNREKRYRQALDRLQHGIATLSPAQWIDQLPVKDMVDFAWISPHRADESLSACLDFFGTDDLDDWHASYREVLRHVAFRRSPSYRPSPPAVAAWLRQGERESAALSTAPWNASQFATLLPELRSLTRRKDPAVFLPELSTRCAEAGVAIAIVRAPQGCPVSGATRYLSPTKALLLLSFRHLSEDHFWFTFFHEAAHLLLHGQRGFFVEQADSFTTKEEEEANRYAEELLIPRRYRPGFAKLRPSYDEVIRFAREIGISAGVLVGQLQKQGRVPEKNLNKAKRRYEWVQLDASQPPTIRLRQ